jgi:3alpha(or 20beta)-hydroxysteroid dehydrogenase
MAESAIIVTGASRGLGRAHAVATADLGAHIYAVDIGDCDETVKEVELAGGRASAHRLDVTDSEQWESLVAAIADDGRTISGLVNNAGVSFRHGFEDTPPDDWQRVIAVNLTGPFLGMRTVAPLMASAGGGSIVNIASIAGLSGYFSPSYGASKAGVIALTKGAALEWGGRGVRVNAVLPGVVLTQMMEGADAGPLIASILESVPSGRAARPEEIGRMVRFLLSDESDYVNGADFVVDGGMSGSGLWMRVRSGAAAAAPSA